MRQLLVSTIALCASLLCMDCSFLRIVQLSVDECTIDCGATGMTGATGSASATGPTSSTGGPTITTVTGNSASQVGRVDDGVVVTGSGLDSVTAARLTGPSGEDLGLTLVLGAQTPTSLTIALTPAARAAIFASSDGRFQLSLTVVGGTAVVDLILLRGEVGLNGATGRDGTKGTTGANAPVVLQSCPAQSFVRSLNGAGATSCGGFTGATQAGLRHYFVGPYDFRPASTATRYVPWQRAPQAMYPDTGAPMVTEMLAPIHLPDGAVIDQFACVALDNNVGLDLSATLVKQDGVNTVACLAAPIGTTGATGALSTIQTTAILPACQTPVANAFGATPKSGYTVSVETTSTTGIEVLGCSVRYQVTSGLP